MTQRKIFGTDGVRGRFGVEPIHPSFLLRLGMAVGQTLLESATGGHQPKALIGKDTRISGYVIESSLEAGLTAVGCDVTLLGPLPTPAIAYLTRVLRHDIGVVISASHNPFDDNGVKFFSSAGNKLSDEWEIEIERRLQHPISSASSINLGRARRQEDAAGRYVEFCKASVSQSLSLEGIRLVVDCAHGAAYQVGPLVFAELGAEVYPIGVHPDGTNINDGVGATSINSVKNAVIERGADFGIALDGDGDRLMMVDGEGRLFDGDALLLILALAKGCQGVVGTQMTNLSVQRLLEKSGIEFARSKVGDRYVLEMLKEKGWMLGGEGSGHIICLDRHSTGDAIIAALQILAVVVSTGKTLAELLVDYQPMVQCLENVRVGNAGTWEQNQLLLKAVKSAEEKLGQRGRVLIRPSGTEPVLRIMVEADQEILARGVVDQLCEAALA